MFSRTRDNDDPIEVVVKPAQIIWESLNVTNQDQKVNRRKDRWVCKDIREVLKVRNTKFISTVMVLVEDHEEWVRLGHAVQLLPSRPQGQHNCLHQGARLFKSLTEGVANTYSSRTLLTREFSYSCHYQHVVSLLSLWVAISGFSLRVRSTSSPKIPKAIEDCYHGHDGQLEIRFILACSHFWGCIVDVLEPSGFCVLLNKL